MFLNVTQTRLQGLAGKIKYIDNEKYTLSSSGNIEFTICFLFKVGQTSKSTSYSQASG